MLFSVASLAVGHVAPLVRARARARATRMRGSMAVRAASTTSSTVPSPPTEEKKGAEEKGASATQTIVRNTIVELPPSSINASAAAAAAATTTKTTTTTTVASSSSPAQAAATMTTTTTSRRSPRPVDANKNEDADISKAEILATATAVKLSNHVYKLGALEPWVARDGFVLRAEGFTSCTRWYVCDKVERRRVTAPAIAKARATRDRDRDDPSVSLSSPKERGDAKEDRAGDPSEAQEATTEEEVTTQRWVVVRGAAWNNEAVDPVKLSVQISRAWPVPMHPGVPLVVHAGVAEMADEFWPEVSPYVASLPPGATLSFTGHSLGGSMALLLMAWSRLRLGLDPARMAPLYTFGSPPVIAVDGWEMHKRSAELAGVRVGAAAAGGADWMGELVGAVGGGVFGGGGGGGVFGGGGGGGGGVVERAGLIGDGGGGVGGDGTGERRRSGVRSVGRSVGGAGGGADARGGSLASSPLELAGLAPDSVRSYVLSNDPVPRMWLAADPVFGAAAANATFSGLLATRERLFGAGIFSQRRFLYEAVGVLYWLQWSAADGTKLSVHRGDGGALAEMLAMDPPWAADSWLTAIQGSLDHNAQNYADSVAYVALKRLGHSTSKAL